MRCGPPVPSPGPRVLVPAPLTLPEYDRSHRFTIHDEPPGEARYERVDREALLSAYAAGKEMDDLRAEFERLWVRLLEKLT